MTNANYECETMEDYNTMSAAERSNAMRTARQAGRESKTKFSPFDDGPLYECWVAGRREVEPDFQPRTTAGMTAIDAAIALAADVEATPNARH